MSDRPLCADDLPAWLILTDCLVELREAATLHPDGSPERIALDTAADRIEGVRAIYAAEIERRTGGAPR